MAFSEIVDRVWHFTKTNCGSFAVFTSIKGIHFQCQVTGGGKVNPKLIEYYIWLQEVSESVLHQEDIAVGYFCFRIEQH